MDNKEILIRNIRSQCFRIAGNIGTHLDKEDKLLKKLVQQIQKVELLIERTAKNPDYSRAVSLAELGSVAGRLVYVYRTAEALGRKYRLATRGRITEKGSDSGRVQIDDSRSITVTIKDLHLDTPMKFTITTLLTQVEKDLNVMIEKEYRR